MHISNTSLAMIPECSINSVSAMFDRQSKADDSDSSCQATTWTSCPCAALAGTAFLGKSCDIGATNYLNYCEWVTWKLWKSDIPLPPPKNLVLEHFYQILRLFDWLFILQMRWPVASWYWRLLRPWKLSFWMLLFICSFFFCRENCYCNR